MTTSNKVNCSRLLIKVPSVFLIILTLTVYSIIDDNNVSSSAGLSSLHSTLTVMTREILNAPRITHVQRPYALLNNLLCVILRQKIPRKLENSDRKNLVCFIIPSEDL